MRWRSRTSGASRTCGDRRSRSRSEPKLHQLRPKKLRRPRPHRPTAAADANALPRNETVYFNGQQWGSVVGWNPYSNNNNNAMAIAQQDNARVTMFETPYLYNMMDGKVYPLLADGDYTWNDARTELTFKLKPAAKWSDGTPLTADDVAYTWATHVKYNTLSAPQYRLHRRHRGSRSADRGGEGKAGRCR